MTKGELSKKKIIETAGDLFWRNGYTKTGLSEILKATGLPKGSFYFYFKKKSDVAKAVLQYYGSRILDLLRSIAETSDSWESFCDSFLRIYREELADKQYYGCPLAVVGMEIAFQEEELVKHYHEAMEEVKEIFMQALRKEGIAEEYLEETAHLCLAVYEGNLVLYRLSKDQSLLLRMNEQLKKVIRGELWKENSEFSKRRKRQTTTKP